jgi:hypothetical protein
VIITNVENNLFEYEGEYNFITLPITQFVRKDGNLAIVSPTTKLFFEKYPQLPKKWGYMISNDVIYPSYTNSKTNLLGIPNKKHYASAVSEEIFKEGLWYIKEESLLKTNFVFYIMYEDFMNEEIIKEIFKESENVVLLKESEDLNAKTT